MDAVGTETVSKELELHSYSQSVRAKKTRRSLK